MKGLIQRILRLADGYGIGIDVDGTEEFVITSSAHTDAHLMKELKGKDLVKRTGRESGKVFYRPGRSVELVIDMDSVRRGESALFLDGADFTVKQKSIKVNDPFDWEGSEDFCPAEYDKLPPPA